MFDAQYRTPRVFPEITGEITDLLRLVALASGVMNFSKARGTRRSQSYIKTL